MAEENHKGERIAKRMARAGLCSRRDAERWIVQGRVKVNGRLIDSAALNVSEDDRILVDGKALPEAERTRLFLYHKPPGLVTTHRDEKSRDTVFSKLPAAIGRVVSVGRLDLNTEGLLLLTNDGALARYLELPAQGIVRTYRVRVHGSVDGRALDDLKNGITIEGVTYQPITATRDDTPSGREGKNTWLQMSLQEGKNREIRKVMEALGLRVTRLIRTQYGPFSLGQLPRGAVLEIKAHMLRKQIPGYFKE